MSPADANAPGSATPVPSSGPADLATLEERALSARVVLGDRDAFALLVGPHLARALLLARRLLKNHNDAEDLVQDAALRALERFDQFDRSRSFAPWFIRLLMNLGLQQQEKIGRRSHEPLELHTAEADTHQEPESTDFWRAFHEAVDQLPARQRAIIMLFDVDGYSGVEIADLLDITPENVRWHLHVARRTLRPLLRAYHPDPNFHP
ncbi:RNA polymerase sigma factor [Gemmatimonas groenlandica]|uniref:RNA polymerase sigma factor n=1 Tax=Gemmatimonas groenlandica TaxID=2732249 RepID=A0A6M4ISY6_9BACT|nr:RNA polymerase sigma factor [Gemmatimonas groenlandica]QJR36647.1 RNA polymerase sigma factor [Gemmatimonas groenlandica]